MIFTDLRSQMFVYNCFPVQLNIYMVTKEQSNVLSSEWGNGCVGWRVGGGGEGGGESVC